MKRSCLTLGSTAASVIALALPGVSYADTSSTDGWSWAGTDGWSWAGDSSNPAPDGWSWGDDTEAPAPVAG